MSIFEKIINLPKSNVDILRALRTVFVHSIQEKYWLMQFHNLRYTLARTHTHTHIHTVISLKHHLNVQRDRSKAVVEQDKTKPHLFRTEADPHAAIGNLLCLYFKAHEKSIWSFYMIREPHLLHSFLKPSRMLKHTISLLAAIMHQDYSHYFVTLAFS